MKDTAQTLICWHAHQGSTEVLINALKNLKAQNVLITQVLCLCQKNRAVALPKLQGIQIIGLEMDIGDNPTMHEPIYQQLNKTLLPKISRMTNLHINVSPGTPAMHAVWLILYSGGKLPDNTKLWSSQKDKATERTSIDPVKFAINTYLSQVQRLARKNPEQAVYELEAKSTKRLAAFERLKRYTMVQGAPILILGERGVGKTRLVESVLQGVKDKKVVVQPCGGLDSELAESLLFGHVKGAYTGAQSNRTGALKEADGGILFLDEVQDLPKAVQRKLIRVFQDKKRRFRQLGSDKEICVEIDLVCASNQPIEKLRELLDADFFDRVAQLTVEVPPLRECREDIEEDWQKVWNELRQQDSLPKEAPFNKILKEALSKSPLLGNLRDLQRLAVLIMAWWQPNNLGDTIIAALAEWHDSPLTSLHNILLSTKDSRDQQIKHFKADLAKKAKQQHGTWKKAAMALGCDEKTLRDDAKWAAHH